ncbi:hypothetical protein [Lysobacter sp. Root690]|uniref:hypothetical protein n=1 Tax=Lysobacter sp. Root690 TaxID=1736588 RepID=UPI0006F341E5|nr:hypothetical protein [Lysobacter sp. Root690]KRB11451.1 hypothetical protein ASD86_03295 [Lysobacter sp. Root690]
MKALSILLACLLSLPASASTSASTNAEPPSRQHEAGIRSVIEAFRVSIVEKDKPRFVALFVPAPVTWQSVDSDEMVERIRKQHPRAAKTRFNPDSTYLSFIDSIVNDPKRIEETFDRIRIDSDGDIASVAFDYRFVVAGVESHHGQESWQLLRTDQGWRIASVIWSMRPSRKASGGR